MGVHRTRSVKVDKSTATDENWPLSAGVDHDIADCDNTLTDEITSDGLERLVHLQTAQMGNFKVNFNAISFAIAPPPSSPLP